MIECATRLRGAAVIGGVFTAFFAPPACRGSYSLYPCVLAR